jgi:hypothetical protein
VDHEQPKDAVHRPLARPPSRARLRRQLDRHTPIRGYDAWSDHARPCAHRHAHRGAYPWRYHRYASEPTGALSAATASCRRQRPRHRGAAGILRRPPFKHGDLGRARVRRSYTVTPLPGMLVAPWQLGICGASWRCSAGYECARSVAEHDLASRAFHGLPATAAQRPAPCATARWDHDEGHVAGVDWLPCQSRARWGCCRQVRPKSGDRLAWWPLMSVVKLSTPLSCAGKYTV